MVNTPPEQAQKPIGFPGMDSGEEFRFYFRRHWTRLGVYIGQYLLWMLVFAVLTIFSGVAGMEDIFTRRLIIIILCLFFLIPNFVFINRLYKHFLYVVVVTDRKVHQFKRTLIAVDHHESVDLLVLQDITKSQHGIIQNIFGFGTLKLEAQNSNLEIFFTPQIDKMYDVIVGLREEARRNMLPPEVKEELAKTVEHVVDVQNSSVLADKPAV